MNRTSIDPCFELDESFEGGICRALLLVCSIFWLWRSHQW